MSEKIEINTLITKHENKCKDCRFEMIDVEDPLFEYGSPLKRVLIDNHTGETYDSVSKLVGLLNEQQTTISALKEENEVLLEEWSERQYYFKKVEDEYHERVMEQQSIIDEQKIAIDEIITDYKKLEKENEQLRTQLLICQQSKNDDGWIQVWEVPPIPKGMRITTFTTSDGDTK